MALNRLVVIGAGSVGGSIGGLLADLDLPVALVARGEHGKQLIANGVQVRTPGKTLQVAPPVFETLDQVVWRPGDLAMLATKLTDAESVLNELLSSAGSEIPIACATNGLQGEVWAAERFQTVLSTLVWMPANHLVPGEVLLYSNKCYGVLDTGLVKDDSGIGQELADKFCRWLNQAGFDAIVREDIQRWKYAKWITNLGNAAQAIVSDDWLSVAEAARAEGETVLDFANVSRVSTNELLERCSRVELKPIDGIQRPGGSTWQSFQRGKPLETRWLEGALADLGDSIGISAPVNRRLAEASAEPREMLAAEILK